VIYIWSEKGCDRVMVSTMNPLTTEDDNELERNSTAIAIPRMATAGSIKNPLFNVMSQGAPGMVQDLGEM
jgi:hypothetical protein